MYFLFLKQEGLLFDECLLVLVYLSQESRKGLMI